ncbi:MAG: tol-pal system YbgF family protein, partial [Bacteroidia bacterium]
KRQINKREALIRRQSRIAPRKLLPYIGTAAAAIALLITTVFVIRQMGSSPDLTLATEQAAKPTIAEASPTPEAKLEAEATIGSSLEADVLPAEIERESEANLTAPLNQPIAQAAPPIVVRRDNATPTLSGSGTPTPIEDQATSPESSAVVYDDFEISAPKPFTNSNSTAVPSAPVTSGQAEQAMEREESIALNDEVVKESLDSGGTEYFDEDELASIPVYEYEERAGNAAPVLEKSKKRDKEVKQTSTAEPLVESAPRRSLEDIQQGQLERTAAITDMIAKAARHLEAKEYDEAIIQLDEVLLTEPQNIVAHHYRAQAYLAKGNDEAAQTSLETIIAIASGENFEADQWALANLYLRLDKKFKARSLLKEIVKAGGTYAKQAEALLAE